MANLDEIPRGQLSTIILTCLLQQDKYGYEIIDEVLKKTNGRMSIKQPSLYSSLKRMEEQSLISSYWRESDIGGRRHYYHLTDLGKKHLEKWKDGLPENFLNEKESSSQEQTKVLQQENLFNLTTQNNDNNKEVKVEEKTVDNSYIQYDLFSNSVIITPPAKNEIKETNIQEEKTIVTNNNIVENKIEENQIIFKDFDFVKKSNKSFADKVKTINSIEEKKFVEQQSVSLVEEKQEQNNEDNNLQALLNNVNDITDISKDEIKEQEKLEISYNVYNENLINEETFAQEQSFSENSRISLNEIDIISNENTSNEYVLNNDIQSEDFFENKKEFIEENNVNESFEKINFEKLEGYIPRPKPKEPVLQQEEKKEEVKDDGVFITDRLNPEDMPKPYKWDSRRFEVYISDNSITPYIDKKETSNYEDRVKELYEKSKNLADNQKIEIIDNVIKLSSYQELQEFYANQNIKFKPYQKKLKKTERDYDMIKINKFNMISALSLFLIVSALSLVAGIVFSFAESAYLNAPITFIIYPAILFIFFIVRYLTYVKSPQKRIAHDINKYKLSFGLATTSILMIPIVFAFNLMAGFTFSLSDIIKHSITIIIPCLIAITYFIYHLIQKTTLKFKGIY